METQSSSENFLKEFYYILFAQKKRIIITTLIIFLASTLVALFWPPTYVATGTFIVKGKKVEQIITSLDKTDIRSLPVTKDDLASEVRILTSVELLTNTAKKLIDKEVVDIDEIPSAPYPLLFIKTWFEDKQQKQLLETDRLSLKLFDAIETKVLPASRIIEIKLFWNDPLKAQEILRLLMDKHISYRQEIYYPAKEGVFFSGQVKNYFKELAENERKLLEFVQNKKVVDPLKEIEINLQLWSGLQKQLTLLDKQLISLNAEVKNLDEALKLDKLQFFSFIENASIKEFGIQIQELAIEQARINKLFMPGSEAAKTLEKQVREVYRILSIEVKGYKTRLENKASAIKIEKELIQKKSEQLSKNNLTLKELAIKLEEIQRESRLLELSFDTYYKRREEANVVQDSQGTGYSAHIDILSQARATLQPFFPKKIQVILMGLLIGLITGLSLGFIREFLVHTFKRAKDIEDVLELPVIFSISDKDI